MKEFKINVAGMNCGNCVNKVTNAINDTEGTENAVVDLAGATATFTLDESVSSLDDVKEAIEEYGFEVTTG